VKRHLAAPVAFASALAGAVVTLAPAPATAAPTCHGKRATIVGSGPDTLYGTRGRDVIVTNGASKIRARKGADLICVTGTASVAVKAGHGDDVVDVQTQSSDVYYYSGIGSDVFDGNNQYTVVVLRPDGHDVVSTYGDGDVVSVKSIPDAGRPRISLGGGDDELHLELASLAGRVDAGPGEDLMTVFQSSKQRWAFDNRRGRASAGHEVRFRWHSFESFDLSLLQAPAVDFKGSDRAEWFHAQNFPKESRELTVRMGGGDDDVTVYARSHGAIDGGPGRDRLKIAGDDRDRIGSTMVAADLAAGTATVSDRITQSWQLSGLEDLLAESFNAADLHGDDGPNELSVQNVCAPTLDGRGGNDTLDGRGETCIHPFGSPQYGPVIVAGGSGDDTMYGGVDDDTLDGGEGTDTADGGDGSDSCSAEVRTACELPTPRSGPLLR
jgi:Ca2+-binding RTX toxin-like protein